MKLRVLSAVVCASLLSAPAAFAEMSLGANVETNSTVESKSNESKGGSDKDLMILNNDGRVEFTMEGRTENENGLFVYGYGALEVTIDGSVDGGDAYMTLGNQSVEASIGRFENEGTFSKGEDVYVAEVNDAIGSYEGNDMGSDPNGVSLKFKMSDSMTFDTRVAFDTADDNNKIGIRPVLVFGSGSFSLKVGGEYIMTTPQDSDAKGEETTAGFAVDASTSFGNMSVGVSGAMGIYDGKDVVTDETTGVTSEVDKNQETKTSVSGWATFGIGEGDTLGLGVGYMMGSLDKKVDGHTDSQNHMYGFVSYAHPLPIEGASVSLAASFASATDIGYVKDDEGTAFGGRVRFNYDF